MPDVSWDEQKGRFVINWRFPKAVHPLTGPWFKDRFPKSTSPAQAAMAKAEKLVEFNAVVEAARQHLTTPEGLHDAVRRIRARLAEIRASAFPVITAGLAAMDEQNQRLDDEIVFMRMALKLGIPVPPPKPKAESVPFSELVDTWVQRRGKATSSKALGAARRAVIGRTRKAAPKGLAEWLGHDNARKVEPKHLQGYLDYLLDWTDPKTEEPLAPKTIEDRIIYVKRVFRVTHKAKPDKLPTNPAADLSYTGETRNHRRDFTPAERVDIARHALRAEPIIRIPNRIADLHGCRLAEVVEADTRDIEVVDGVGVVFHVRYDYRRLTSPKRTLKNGASARPFVVHRTVADDLLAYRDLIVAQHGHGPLFHLDPDKDGRINDKASAINMDWLRNVVGIKDPNAHFHSHRHGFKTMARQHEIEEQYADAIAGHANGSVGRKYGIYPYPVLRREIDRIQDPLAVPTAG
jgi:integrase